ncbi:MAG: AMP-binding protein, partial [Bifidobacteriaceae bacterium]|nr:AMP-binding protein [Bifidobacteriaceae bacterium]
MDAARLLAALGAALDGGQPFVPHAVAAVPPPARLPGGAAIAVPTSGSTGDPRWVALSASAVCASARLSAARLGGAGHWLLALPPTHIAGLNVVIRALLSGGALRAMAPGRFTAEGFAAAAAALPPGARFTSLVPTQLRRLLDGGSGALRALAGFDAVLVGGAALDLGLRERAVAAGVRVVETYGMAETCGGCVYDGVPLDDVSVRVTDDGRIAVAGPGRATGDISQAEGR